MNLHTPTSPPVSDMSCSANEPHAETPRWHTNVLIASAIHSGVWGVFIIVWPATSAVVYGFADPPVEEHLWQGTGLFISLLAIGYGIAAADPWRHWSVVLTGLLAKVFGAAGMCLAVARQQVSPDVLWLLPFNDVIWWWPFWRIVRTAATSKNGRFSGADGA